MDDVDVRANAGRLRNVLLATSATRAARRDLAWRGGRTEIIEAGPIEGRPVLFLHGGWSNAAAWLPLVEKLPGVRALAVDLPGHGLADPYDYRRGSIERTA